MKKVFGLLIVLVLGYAGIFAASRWLGKNQLTTDEKFSDEELYFSAHQLSLLGSDFRGLFADWYWIKSLQYLGDKVVRRQDTTDTAIDINDLRPLNPRLLYPMLDTASTLDPQFMTIYSYGASVLPAIDNDQAIKLLEKGIAANPDNWQLYHNLGYIYWRLGDYAKAAEFYSTGATKPEAPSWMKLMSANMQAQGGSHDFALQIYQQMFETAEDAQTKNFAELRYNQVLSQIQLEMINQSLQSFKEKSGRCANSFGELLPLLTEQSRKSKIDLQINSAHNPVDPTNIPYLLDKNDCSAKLNPDSKIPKF